MPRLSPYLFGADGLADPHLTVREESRPINGIGKADHRLETHRRGPLYFHSR